MPNYKQSSVSGEKWQRAVRVQINNPYNETPSIMFVEEEIVEVNGEVHSKLVANLSAAFDANRPDHVALYNQLNAIYTELREARDAG